MSYSAYYDRMTYFSKGIFFDKTIPKLFFLNNKP